MVDTLSRSLSPLRVSSPSSPRATVPAAVSNEVTERLFSIVEKWGERIERKDGEKGWRERRGGRTRDEKRWRVGGEKKNNNDDDNNSHNIKSEETVEKKTIII